MTFTSHISRRTQVLALTALASAAVATTAFSSASLSADSARNGRADAGTLSLQRSTASAVVDAAGMRPGQSRDGTITITNNGEVRADARVLAAGLDDTPSVPGLSSVLELAIDDCAATPDPECRRYTGLLKDFSSAELGELDGGESRQVRITLTWPVAADDHALQGAETALTLRWELESA